MISADQLRSELEALAADDAMGEWLRQRLFGMV